MPSWRTVSILLPFIALGGFFVLVALFCGRSAEERYCRLTPSQRKAVPLAALLLFLTVLSAVQGVNHHDILDFTVSVTAFFFVPLALANGILLFCVRPRSEWRSNLAIPAIGICAFAMYFALRPWLNLIGERWDFARADVEGLRREVASCLARPEIYEGPNRSGYSVLWSREILPVLMSEAGLKFDASYLLRKQGVFMVTDGWVNHKGGYLILPPGSTYVLPNCRKVCDGIYRIEPSQRLNVYYWVKARRKRWSDAMLRLY
jgi:hypothetical protein